MTMHFSVAIPALILSRDPLLGPKLADPTAMRQFGKIGRAVVESLGGGVLAFDQSSGLAEDPRFPETCALYQIPAAHLQRAVEEIIARFRAWISKRP